MKFFVFVPLLCLLCQNVDFRVHIEAYHVNTKYNTILQIIIFSV